MSARHIAKHAMLAIALVGALSAGPADARRGGSFGSRGSRTYSAPRSTNLNPGYTAPVSRSMTDRSTAASPRYAPSTQPGFAQQRRPGMFGGFGGGLIGGLLAGGLIGHFMGGSAGWGGGAGGGGILPLLFQLALIGGGIWLLMRLFRRKSAAPAFRPDTAYPTGVANGAPGFGAAAPMNDLAITPADQAEFERLLVALQEAFSREDYAALRAITTPEIMSYLAEELGDNASNGRRNEVTGTNLIDGEVSEAWQEDDKDYATIALRYESSDIMRDRSTGAPLAGADARPTQTTELWTFVRPSGASGGWKVSAIQDA